MNLSNLKTGSGKLMIIIATSLFFTACNDDQSANNSTSGQNENNTDTTVTAVDTTAIKPTARKRAGKVTTAMNEENAAEKIEMDKQGYYNRTEVSPAYNGGQTAMENYIVNNIEYPQQAIDNNAEGIVKVRFAVDEKGNISNVSTIGNKIGYGLEEEAIRIVSNMPSWTPGQVKGKKVKTWRTLPINYRLEG